MNAICICRVFTKLLLLGAHSVSMKYCSCCLDLGMVQLSISHIDTSSHQLLWSQTIILSVHSHLFSLCFLNFSYHEYATSCSPESYKESGAYEELTSLLDAHAMTHTLTSVYRCSSRQESVIIFHVHFNKIRMVSCLLLLTTFYVWVEIMK